MKIFFQYFYYRIAKLNFKRSDRKEDAIISVTVTQTLFVINIIMACEALFISNSKQKLSSLEIGIFLIIFFAIDHYNSKLYKGIYDTLDDRWRDESKYLKTRNMIIVIVTIIVSWFLVFVNFFVFERK